MAHHGNACFDDASHGIHDFDAAFHFQGIDTRLFHYPDGIPDAFRTAHLIAAERHVAHHETMLAGTGHGCGVINHLVYADGQGVFVAGHHVGGRVADQDAVNAGGIDNPSRRVVIGREHRDLLTRLLHLRECS